MKLILKYLPNMTIIESVCWRMKQMILSHLAYPGVFAVCISIQFTFEAVVLDLRRRLSQILVNFFMTDCVIDFNTGLT